MGAITPSTGGKKPTIRTTAKYFIFIKIITISADMKQEGTKLALENDFLYDHALTFTENRNLVAIVHFIQGQGKETVEAGILTVSSRKSVIVERNGNVHVRISFWWQRKAQLISTNITKT